MLLLKGDGWLAIDWNLIKSITVNGHTDDEQEYYHYTHIIEQADDSYNI